jgi:hypothetical protein
MLMIRMPLLAMLALTMTLSACGGFRQSKLNPFNWFGRSQAVAVVPLVSGDKAADPRPLVQQVVSMSVDPVPEGVIVRATGLPPTQGYWKGELVALPLDDKGRQVFEFRLAPPPEPTRVSTEFSREVTVGAFVSNLKLSSINEIVVQGETNARSSRR